MRDNEIREASLLLGASLREVTTGVGRVHRTVAGRVETVLRSTLGDVVLPVTAVSGSVTRLTYAAVGLGLNGASRIGGAVVARRVADDRPAGDTAGRTLAMVNGSHGHLLAARQSPLALTTTVRHGGRDIEPSASGLRAAWPDATSQVAVYVHGLLFSEREWDVPTPGDRSLDGGPEQPGHLSLPGLLADELGLTPVTVRYNTGRQVVDNAQQLSTLLAALISRWPVPVERVVLVGHSMGGLVCRAMLAEPAAPGGDWRDVVSDLVTLGSPHDGSWLERAVVQLTPHLHRRPATAWFGEQIDGRSDGIRDLGGRPIGRPSRPVRERAVVATVAGTGRLGRAFGDLLVGTDSARGDLPANDVAVITGLHHAALLHDPRVGRQLVAFLGTAPAGLSERPPPAGPRPAIGP